MKKKIVYRGWAFGLLFSGDSPEAVQIAMDEYEATGGRMAITEHVQTKKQKRKKR